MGVRLTAMGNQSFEIRCLQSGEQALLKSLRLTSLRYDPQSYWENTTEAESYEDAYWSDLALQLTRPNGSRMFILEQDGVVRGFVYGISKGAGEHRIGGLWVEPACRGRKYGYALVQRVVSWARTQPGMTSIRLWSPTGSMVCFYEKNGFKPLGRIQTHPSDGRQIVEMEWYA
jgi:GNAT superfamily N-acetyltransferase